jgi:DAACS family dicarboxylate/amino acid:cation (Na+ or H+) symporter
MAEPHSDEPLPGDPVPTEHPPPGENERRRMPLHTKILLGLLIGLAAGLAVNAGFGGDPGQAHPHVDWIVRNVTDPIGELFLRLLQMIVVPLVFSSLVVGVAGIGDVRKLGRVGLKAFAYTFVISAISVLIGLALANGLRPGDRLSPETRTALQQRHGKQAEAEVGRVQKDMGAEDSPLMQVVKTIVPKNPVAAAAGETPNMLHLMFFALILGIALTLIPAAFAAPVLRVAEGLYHATAKIIDLVMHLAPYAVACLLFSKTAIFGLDLLQSLLFFILTVLAGLAIHMFIVYSLAVRFMARISPLEFFRRIKLVMLTAFSTSSSNATLPTALRVSEQNLGVPRDINSFVLTIGATANQNGTALYEGVTVLFLAQLAGVELTLAQQLMVVYLAILGGIGTAGVPSGSIPFIIGILAMIGIEPGLIAIILGVDRILDMCRTTLNVVGDLTVAAYVARSEGYELLGKGTAKGST